MKRLVFTVTNDLNYDQRMIRISSSLAATGYQVLLVGRRVKNSLPLIPQPFRQKRLFCFFSRGKAFYIEYNFRLFWFLLFQKIDIIVAIDLDTILPCHFVSLIKKTKKAYDAHELFCEMKEIVRRPLIYRLWKMIERFAIPRFPHGYTVNHLIADELRKMYAVNYQVIQNVPVLQRIPSAAKNIKYILYQGAVNEGRSFETLIPAMKQIEIPLIICGDGNFMKRTEQLVKEHQVEQKVIFKGKIPPPELRNYTLQAWIGVTFFDDAGLSNYYSLANRFFDYIHAGIPQLCVDFPLYREINNQYKIAVLLGDLGADAIAKQINRLLANDSLYQELQQNCLRAREDMNWQQEEKKLLSFYQELIN